MLEPILQKISAHIYNNHSTISAIKMVVVVACIVLFLAIVAIIKVWIWPQKITGRKAKVNRIEVGNRANVAI